MINNVKQECAPSQPPAGGVLFLLKSNLSYGVNGSPIGLQNSARFVEAALTTAGIRTDLVEVVDGNSIDREVARFRPHICILEALWAPPSKVAELQKLWPGVEFVVRIHSKIPFLATEGIALDYIRAYHAIGATLATNSQEAQNTLSLLLGSAVSYLPNIYPLGPWEDHPFQPQWRKGELSVACFGSLRLLKNQLQQAAAAIVHANETNRTLWFHINSTRIEHVGTNVLKNLRALFRGSGHHLVEHGWYSHEDLLSRLRHMDLGLQVSYSESFNIIAADYVAAGVPIVVSPDVDWASRFSKADPNSLDDIVSVMALAELLGDWGIRLNRRRLTASNKKSIKSWLKFIEEGEG